MTVNMRRAVAHEYDVQSWLADAGWRSERFGMGAFPESLTSVFQGSVIGHLPDLVAWRGRDVVFLDAKSTRPRPPYCIAETASVRFLVAFAAVVQRPTFLVYATGDVIDVDVFAMHSFPGNQTGNGTGDPFLSCPLAVGYPFATMFGGPITREKTGLGGHGTA